MIQYVLPYISNPNRMTDNREIAFRHAMPADLADIKGVLRQAREYQLSCGNSQWRDGYPSEAIITTDIAGGQAVVLTVADCVAGYAVLVAGDIGYRDIPLFGADNGCQWCVIHRLALGDSARGHGLGRLFLAALTDHAFCQGMAEVRIDTGADNRPMRHLAESLGYEYLGEAEFTWGGRVVYRKRSGEQLSLLHEKNKAMRADKSRT